MPSIISQRSSKFYLSITFGVLFCLVMALFTGSLHGQATSKVGEVIMILMSAGLVFGAFYIPIRFYKNAPRITIDKESISFNNSTYYWNELENIGMTGKRPFKFIGERKEGVSLKFKYQDEKYIFDDMYSNSPQIKNFIQQVVINKAPFGEYQKMEIDPRELTFEKFNYYKGYQLLSFEGIILWGLNLFLIYICTVDYLRHHHSLSICMPIIFCSLILIIFSRRMYYFGISNKFLVIRNQNFFWIKRAFQLSDIKEIVFEQRHKMPVTLRVINEDFTYESYPASTLWNKRWRQLKVDLENKGIKVRNECIPDYEPFEFKFFND